MPRIVRAATLFVAFTLLLTACANATAQTATSSATLLPEPTAMPTMAPTTLPTPTAIPLLAQHVLVAGVDVGGNTLDDARTQLEKALQPLLRPLEVQADTNTITIKPEDIDFKLALDDMLGSAQAAQSGTQVDLQVHYDESKLRAALSQLIPPASAPAAVSVITSTTTISRSFAISGNISTIDLDAAVEQIDARLHAVGSSRRVTLTMIPDENAARPTPEQLQAQLELMVKEWKGTAGIYVYDLASGEQIAGVNEKTAFTAASTIKVAIMLNDYINLDSFTAKQDQDLKKMIIESDNLAANRVLAASAGGTTTEAAFDGANNMSAMLADLGLTNTFLYVPFESSDFIKLYKVKFKTGPKQGGETPFINASNTLRTTPSEMAQIYIDLEECSQGEGVLLEKFSDHLNPDRCKEMIARLEANGDHKRMMSGLPAGAKVAHKSGWIPPEVQGDVGIVRSPGGDFVIAIYLYQTGERYSDVTVEKTIGNFARLVYTYYNPVAVAK